MLQLEFHTGVADKLGYACRLLRKAYRQGARVVVCGESERLARLDTLLWTFEQLEFVPHARLRAGERAAGALQRTPIWLADRDAQWPAADAVVNLGDAAVPEPQRWARVIEIVGDDEADVRNGRARWRQYAAAGHKPALAQLAPGSPKPTDPPRGDASEASKGATDARAAGDDAAAAPT